jgi:hypothetical protein
MLMLNGLPFTTGLATYYNLDPNNARRQHAIYIQVVLPTATDLSVYALVDTGTPYCIFETEIVEALGVADASGESMTLRTAYGSFQGTIQRLTIRLAAEQGDSLDIDASVFVTDAWGYGNFVGYSGFLERFRFAFDPATNAFYFGPHG